MHISLNLPQFNRERTLLIVTDKQHAKFYIAYQGEITELVDYAIAPNPEDAKLASGGWRKNIPRKGKLVKSPLGLEGQYFAFAKQVRLTSLRLFNQHAFKNVFLYGPHHYLHELKDRLHPYVLQRLIRIFSGDFIHDHPLELVRRVKEVTIPDES